MEGVPFWMPVLMLAAGGVIVVYVLIGLSRQRAGLNASPRAVLTDLVNRLKHLTDRTPPSGANSAQARSAHAPSVPAQPVPAPQSPALRDIDTSLTELRRLHRDLVELAQRQAVEADVRAARLEELIAKADDRLSRLNRAERAANKDTPAPPTAPTVTGTSTITGDLRVVTRPVSELVTSAVTSTAAAQARTHAMSASPAQPTAVPATTPGLSPEALQREVCRLADQGLKAIDIAKELKQHTGKVELILALRR